MNTAAIFPASANNFLLLQIIISYIMTLLLVGIIGDDFIPDKATMMPGNKKIKLYFKGCAYFNLLPAKYPSYMPVMHFKSFSISPVVVKRSPKPTVLLLL